MKTTLPGLFLLILMSCSSPDHGSKDQKYFYDLLKEADQLKLTYFNHGDTLSQLITDQMEIEPYKEVVNAKVDPRHKLQCDSTGKIQFFHKGNLLLNVWFSTRATGSRYDKPCVTYSIMPDVYSTLFTDRSQRDVDDYYYKLRSTANRMAKDL